MKQTRITELFGIKYPLVQAGMVWVSGGKLAAAAANSGCLGVIGAGSMKPELLKQHIIKAQSLTSKPLAINLPLLYHDIEAQINIALELGIKHFITSAGSPRKYTGFLKQKGVSVTHVTSSAQLAKKCEDAGVDAVIVEGFEAGGHNGRDELTTMVLVPQCKQAVNIPIIAAGGFGNGDSLVAGLALGAEGIQLGTRFMMTQESSAHLEYKKLLQKSETNATMLMMKKHIPVRLVKNDFFRNILALENSCASKEEIIKALGKGRAKRGMLEGELNEGELEAGQVCGSLNDLPNVEVMVEKLVAEYHACLRKFQIDN